MLNFFLFFQKRACVGWCVCVCARARACVRVCITYGCTKMYALGHCGGLTLSSVGYFRRLSFEIPFKNQK